MKERAIVIFELEGKSGRKKKGRGLERIDGRDGERSVLRLSFFNLRQHALIISNEKHEKKGYQSLVSSFSVLQQTERPKPSIKCDDTTLSCHVI
jgi:hypothetical protein